MTAPRDRLRIAVQKSGRLSESSLALLGQCGLAFRQSRDKLFCFGENLPIDLLLVRDDDIPGLIADGVCELGVVGRNVLLERRLALEPDARDKVQERRALGFGRCRLALALPVGEPYEQLSDLAGRRIATTYPKILAQFLEREGVAAQVVELSGSVEIAPRIGTADAICDLVSSGATLAANQLREVAPVMESEAVLAATATHFADPRGALIDLLLRRLDGVLAVRESKLVLLRTSRERLAEVSRLLPGGPIPTITSVDGHPDEVSLQALCLGAISWNQMEAMQRAGARALMVLPVEKMLA